MNPTNHKVSKKRKYLFHDVFSGIIYYIPEEKSLGSRLDSNIIFYELKKKYASKSNLLDDICFSTDGIAPVSDEVTDALFSLTISHFLYFDPENGKLRKNKKANKSIEDYVILKFNKKQLKQLEMMAIDYIKILGSDKRLF